MPGPALPADPASRAFRRFRSTGDPTAVTEVFDLVGGELYALAAHIVRDSGEAEDVVQETFLVALARTQRFDERRAVTPWLVGILIKEAAKVRRRSARHGHVADLVQSEAEQPLAVLLTGEVRTVVGRTLASLPHMYREVLRPVLEDGVAPGALAAKLGRAPGTVRAQLHRGLELLRHALPRGLAPGVAGALAVQLGAGRGLAAVRDDVARRAAIEGPALALAGAGMTVTLALPWIGAIVMSTNAITAVFAAAALGVVAFVATRPDSKLSREDVVPGPVAAFHTVAMQEPLVSADAAAERMGAAVATPPVAPGMASSVGDSARRVVLRGSVTGTRAGDQAGLRLLVRSGVPERVLRTEPVSGDGPFTVDLTEELRGFDPLSSDPWQRVTVRLLGDGYAEVGGWARPVEEGRAGEQTLSIDLTARPIERTLRGRVTAASGTAVHRSNLVEFVAAGVTRDDATLVLPATRVDGDGQFELELTEAGPGTLVVAAQGQGVLHVAIPADATGNVDLGNLVLPRGAMIAGRATARTGALPSGSYVLACAPFAPAAWNERALELQARDGRVHFESVRANVEEGGEFQLTGLEPGLRYEVVLVPARIEGFRAGLIATAVRGLAVTAPAEGVALTESLAAVHFVVQSMGAPVERVSLWQLLPEGDPWSSIPMPLRRGRFDTPGGPRPEGVVLVAADAVTTLRVSARTHGSVDVEVNPAAMPVEGYALLGPLVIDLGAASVPATVEWRIAYGGPGTLERAQLALWVHDQEGGSSSLGSAPVLGGTARFEQAPVGTFFARPELFLSPTIALADLPLALEASAGQEVTIRAGEVTVVEAKCALGGRIELSLVGRSHAHPAPRVMLIESGGNEVLPALITSDGTGHRQAPGLDGDGPFLVERALPAGQYTLRVEGEGYRRAEREVTVRRGEVTRVTLSLEFER